THNRYPLTINNSSLTIIFPIIRKLSIDRRFHSENHVNTSVSTNIPLSELFCSTFISAELGSW
ncbi:MAG: hypothetical protein ACOCWG_04590, partial [bacterium]